MANTALGYQMMIEERLLDSMRDAARDNRYYLACSYAVTYATFLDVNEDEMPAVPMKRLSDIQNIAIWEKYYFELLECIVIKMKNNLAEVRVKYGKGTAKPKILKRNGESNAIID